MIKFRIDLIRLDFRCFSRFPSFEIYIHCVSIPIMLKNLWLQFALTYGCGFIQCNCFQTLNEKSICIVRSLEM